jgi:hypothetical protein
MKKFIYLCLLLCTIACAAQSRIYPYSDGHLWGLTNANLDVIAPPQFDTSVFFNAPSYAIAIKNKKYGTIGRDGKTQISFSYDKILQLQENFGNGSFVRKYLLLNLNTGKAVTPDLFDAIGEYCYCDDKQFVVAKGGQKFIISGITGKQTGKTGYEEARFFSRDFGSRALVKTGGKYGLIDTKTGAWVIPAKYNDLSIGRRNQKGAFAATAAGKTTWLDGNGKRVKEEPRPESKEQLEEAATVGFEVPPKSEDSNKELYVYNLGNNNWKLSVETRSSGNTKVFETFDLNGYTAVEKITYGYWNKKQPAIIKAVKDGKAGLIGLKGEVLLPFEYDNIEVIKSLPYYKTTRNNKVGLLKNNLVEFKKPVLKQLLGDDYHLNALLVEMPGGQIGYMDKETGKIYIPGIEE